MGSVRRAKNQPKNTILVHRNYLKPDNMTDEELLADAMRQAEKWQETKNRNKDK